jgi:hypothetical protein
MNLDETSECIYLNVQALNPSQTNSNSVVAQINQRTNPIVDDLSKYNVYLQSMTLVTSDLPFTNMRRYIQWDVNNFTSNKTNMSISFQANDAAEYPFIIAGPNPLIKGFNVNPGNPNEFNGITVFLQYISENSTLPNPGEPGFTSSIGYNRSYFNVHSINQWLGFLNNAINTALDTITGTPFQNQMYFYYTPETQIYGLIIPDDIKTDYSFYVNSFLERYIDAFRWRYLQNSTITDVNYTGKDYQFVMINYPFNETLGTYNYWTFTAEYSTVSALCDTHSILVRSDKGSLSTLRQQIIPYSVDSDVNSLNLPLVTTLKNIDIDFSTLQYSTINNSFIQYESSGLFFPINGLSETKLQNIDISIWIMTIDNIMYPVSIPAGGFANVKFVLKRKKNK